MPSCAQNGDSLELRVHGDSLDVLGAISIAFAVAVALAFTIAMALGRRTCRPAYIAAFSHGPTLSTATLRIMVRRSFKRLGEQVHRVLRLWRLPRVFVAPLPPSPSAAIAIAIATSLRISIAATYCCGL